MFSEFLLGIFQWYQIIRRIVAELDSRQRRASESSYIRFGKRSPPTTGMDYSKCVAYSVSRAKSRKELLQMLAENGCLKLRGL